MPGMGGGMNRDGAMMPGMGQQGGGMFSEAGQQGGGAPGGMQGGAQFGPYSALAGGAQKVAALQSQLYMLQTKCMGGDGRACHQAKIVEQQLSQAQAQQQGALNIERMRGNRGTMGINGRGRRGTDPADISYAMLQNMYGSGGGGGLGSSNMGGGGW